MWLQQCKFGYTSITENVRCELIFSTVASLGIRTLKSMVFWGHCASLIKMSLCNSWVHWLLKSVSGWPWSWVYFSSWPEAEAIYPFSPDDFQRKFIMGTWYHVWLRLIILIIWPAEEWYTAPYKCVCISVHRLPLGFPMLWPFASCALDTFPCFCLDGNDWISQRKRIHLRVSG